MMETFRDQAVEAVACLAGQVTGAGLKEVLLVPAGEIQSKKGTFILDAQAARLIVESFQAHDTPIPVDYEHQTLGGEFASPSGRAPAAGWIERVWWQEGIGLKGLVAWTDKARKAIRAAEYRFLSPVLIIRNDDKRAIGLHSAALTNVPAIASMPTLAASQRKGFAMTEHNQGSEQGSEENAATPEQKMGELKTVLKGQGAKLGDTASFVEILDAAIAVIKGDAMDASEDEEIAASVRESLGLKPDAGKSEVVLAMRLGSGASSEVVAMRNAEADRLAKERVDRYLDKGVLLETDTRAMTAALALAKESPERFEALMRNVVPIVPQGRTIPPDARDLLIHRAAGEFRGDEALKKTTSLTAFVDLQLRDAGLEIMSEDERRDYAQV